ncbi:uncharacterized protein LAJ45_09309 [Morchella importuna]|uniref:ER membrane protein complex subunit 4 n=1 Tax=Morchella conica CCBAS932 TaxID=1392247 RepID=A0A3N4KI14_9PEZI|nr:uncharacterized protein LAJ45_09309 [Morchella importuna]KAH8146626.1 hypothetical protein LAJ45_09309 [Morchella importuna]RPB09058.1 hypothetical protein P167DRAFT_511417 [Morchella conica CCBAS932]
MAPSGPPRLAPLPSPQWVIDLNNLPTRPKPTGTTPDPPGFSHSPHKTKPGSKPTPAPTPIETDELFLKKAWELALAPAKSIPMNAIMMYMSGNTLQIFSIMMTAMLFMNPLKALSSVGATFARFENERTRGRLWVVKMAYVGLQVATIVLGVWKVNGMGLLPTTRSDWLAWERERQPLEYSAAAFQ